MNEQVTTARSFDEAVQRIDEAVQIRVKPTDLGCARLISKTNTLPQLKEAVEVVTALNIHLTPPMFLSAISNLFHNRGDLNAAIEFLGELGIERTDDLLLRVYQRARTVGQMLDAFEAALDCGLKPDPVAASKAIFLAGRFGPRSSPSSFDLSLEIFYLCRNIGVHQTTQIIDSLMASAVSFDQCREVLRIAVADSIELDSGTFEKMASRAQNVLEAIEALHWTIVHTGKLDCEHLHSLQNGQSLTFAGFTYEVVFSALGVSLDEQAFSNLMRNSFHCIDKGEVEFVRSCIEFEPHNGMFVAAASSIQGLSEAIELFEVMLDFGVSPNTRTISKMISGLLDLSEASVFLEKLNNDQLDKTEINYGSLVNFFPDASAAFEEMPNFQRKYGLTCDEYTLERLIHLTEDFQVGLRILRRFKDNSITSNSGPYHLLKIAGTFDESLEALGEYSSQGLVPSSGFGYQFFEKVKDLTDAGRGIDAFENAGGQVDLSAFFGIVRGLTSLRDTLEFVDGFSRFEVEIDEHFFHNVSFKVKTADDSLVLKSWLERRRISMTAARWRKIIKHCAGFEEAKAMLEIAANDFPLGSAVYNAVANKAETVSQVLSISEYAQSAGGALSKKSLGRCASLLDEFSDALLLLEQHILYDLPVSSGLLNKSADVAASFSEVQAIGRLIANHDWEVTAWFFHKCVKLAESQADLDYLVDLAELRNVSWRPAANRNPNVGTAAKIGVWRPKLKRLLADEEKNAVDGLRKLKVLTSEGAPIRNNDFSYLYSIADDFDSAFGVLQFQVDLRLLPSNFEFGRIVRLTRKKPHRIKLLRKLFESNQSISPGRSLEKVLYLEGLKVRAANEYERSWIKKMGGEDNYSIDRDMALWGPHLARRGNPVHSKGGKRRQGSKHLKFLGLPLKKTDLHTVSFVPNAPETEETPENAKIRRVPRKASSEAQSTTPNGQPRKAETEFANSLGYAFSKPDLLVEALTHGSASASSGHNNQRLASIGNNFLRLTLSEALLASDPLADVGLLTPRINSLVRKETCGEIAQMINLGSVVRLGRSEIKSGGRKNVAILSTAMDALLGAIYLDGGAQMSRETILKLWESHLDRVDDDARDPKTKLQERVVELGTRPPKYSVISREGPDHAPLFVVEVRLEDGRSARAQANKKREAEKKAARALLDKL